MKTYPLPLHPLEIVVCPEGYVLLKISEAPYIEMVKDCLINKSAFGITTNIPEKVTFLKRNFPFLDIAISVEIVDADESMTDSMWLKCKGTHRIKIHSFTKDKNGFIVGQVSDLPNDLEMTIPEDLQGTSGILKELLDSVSSIKALIPQPYKLECASWVSNRWTEILGIPLLEKQRLMKQESPIIRLELIHDLLQQSTHSLNSKIRD